MILFFVLIAIVVVVIAASLQHSKSVGQRPIARAARQPTSYRPAPPSPKPSRSRQNVATPEQCWVPPGGAAEVAGYRLEGGMVYVGRDLPAVREGWREDLEPALIHPHLRVERSNPDRSGSSMGYWPSYGEISARARAGYLEWLASGRRQPGAYIGYVFLFFYGIERRVLVDAEASEAARGEIDGLLSEVEALLDLYGDNGSFRGYASSFLEVGRLLRHSVPLSELKPPEGPTGYEVPLSVRLALGAYAAQEEPIPPEWALSWVLTSPAFRFRTPAKRCPEEFRHLFALRYVEAFRDGGLRIKPNKTRLTAQYRPASPSFGFGGVDLKLPDLPDVTVLSAPVRKLQALVDRVCDELDGYSRWIGRRDDRTSPAALALLPPELASERESPESHAFLETVRAALGDGDAGVLDAAALVAAWPSKEAAQLSKRESEMLARFLEHRGIGMEPDGRFGGLPLGKAARAVLFRLEEAGEIGGGDAPPSPRYQAAAVLLHLAAAVAAADGEVDAAEERHLEEHLERGLELLPAERQRLRHYLRWLIEEPPGMAGLKGRLEGLAEAQRRDFGRILVTVAGADGRIDPAEIKVLRKVYPLLGLDPDAVFSDVHALVAGEAPPAEEPVTVIERKLRKGFSLPPGVPGEDGPAAGFTLDPEKLEKFRTQTERIVDVLRPIFDDGEAPGAAAPPPSAPAEGPVLCGLDAVHSAFLRRLMVRTRWERLEIERLAAELSVLPDGALELLNQAAVDTCGELLLEGDEVIEIDAEILEEMTR